MRSGDRRRLLQRVGFGLALIVLAQAAPAASAPLAPVSWWVWPLALFGICFLLGIVAVPAGVGGGVLFVPIVGGFFPFHLDFVRGAGLLVAMASALAAAPDLLRNGLADLRVALPLMLVASLTSILGALIGLSLSASTVNIALGLVVLGIVVLIARAKRADHVDPRPDRIATRLGLQGSYFDLAVGKEQHWAAQRTGWGLFLFAIIGVIGGMFGVGAGWANVPVLNLVMALPLKVAAGTSGLILTGASASATWMYLDSGAVLPIVAVPSAVGMMLGARLGARLLRVLPAANVRRIVIALLAFAGMRTLLKGLGIWM
jgi:uncharacterized membrane protein YfcA